jgi:hypothetical protein
MQPSPNGAFALTTSSETMTTDYTYGAPPTAGNETLTDSKQATAKPATPPTLASSSRTG